MKPAIVILVFFASAAAAVASDPTDGRRFEFEESTLEKTRAAMKRLHNVKPVDRVQVERLFPLRSMTRGQTVGGTGIVATEYDFERQYKLILLFDDDNRFVAAVLYKGVMVVERFWK